MAEEEDKVLYRTAPSRLIFAHLYFLTALLAGGSTALSLRFVDLGLPEVAGFDLDLVLSLVAGVFAFVSFIVAELKRITRRYLVLEHRVARREGILSRRVQYMPYTKVERVELNQSILKRLFGLGDLLVDTGEDHIVLEAIRHPDRVERILAERVRNVRTPPGAL